MAYNAEVPPSASQDIGEVDTLFAKLTRATEGNDAEDTDALARR